LSDIATLPAELSECGPEDEGRERFRYSSPCDNYTPPCDSSGTELMVIRRRIEYILERISDCNFPDVAPGSDITPEGLRSVSDTQISSVRGFINECKDHIYTYAALPRADAQLIQTALTQ
jgi:hypothetical protein